MTSAWMINYDHRSDDGPVRVGPFFARADVEAYLAAQTYRDAEFEVWPLVGSQNALTEASLDDYSMVGDMRLSSGYEVQRLLREVGLMLVTVAAVAPVEGAPAEVAAQGLYETWSDQPEWVPWVPGGNSDKQQEARRQIRENKGG